MPDEPKDPRAILQEAIRKRDELNTFIKVYQDMLGLSGGDAQASADKTNGGAAGKESLPAGEVSDPLSVVYPGLFFGKSQPQAVRILLERVRRPVPTKVVIEALKKGGLTVGGKKPAINLWGILNRNADFILVPKAGWGLVDWYDAKALAKLKKEGPDAEGDEVEEEEGGEADDRKK